MRDDNDEDDENKRRCREHCGFSPLNMSRVVNHKKFPVVLERVKRQWQIAVAKQERNPQGEELDLVIAVYCEHGKHRSVAVAECLRHIGEQIEGLRVIVNHLCKQRCFFLRK